ncbi:MAG: ChaB family protein [Candidatus Aenigmatarchaeota archaeon]
MYKYLKNDDSEKVLNYLASKQYNAEEVLNWITAASALNKKKIVASLLPYVKDVTLPLQEAIIFKANDAIDILKNKPYNPEKIAPLGNLTKRVAECIAEKLKITKIASVEKTKELQDLKIDYLSFLANNENFNLKTLFGLGVAKQNKFALRLCRLIHAAIGEEAFKEALLEENKNREIELLDTETTIEEEIDFEENKELIANIEEEIIEIGKELNKFSTYVKDFNDALNSFINEWETLGDEEIMEETKDELELILSPAKSNPLLVKKALFKKYAGEKTVEFSSLPKEIQNFVKIMIEVKEEELRLLNRINEINMAFNLVEGRIQDLESISKIRKALTEKVYPTMQELQASTIDVDKFLVLFSTKSAYITPLGKSLIELINEYEPILNSILEKMKESSPEIYEKLTKIKEMFDKMSQLTEKEKRPSTTFYRMYPKKEASSKGTKEEIQKEITEKPKESRERIRKMIDELPIHAQDIWISTFNTTKKQGKDDEYAAKVAWDAVKKQYEKKDNKWVKKD